ncbi:MULTISPECIES: hypothetical protein [Cytobacillus]|nr:hypothetical protein [Cytobacillus oceanisediminis]MCS0827640.1 hypothetical protein [Cytobacillus firmus]
MEFEIWMSGNTQSERGPSFTRAFIQHRHCKKEECKKILEDP